ncbi:MAG TPA: hypothetical protein VGM25_16390 [Caulobacteraceae bacterium]
MALLVAAAALAALACPVENAGYTLRTAPGITARFRDVDSGRDWPSGLALGIHSATTNRTYWFLPWDGGTDDLQNLASTTDVDAKDWKPPSPDGGPRPLGDLEYVEVDQGYGVIDAIPHRNAPAPAHILIPGLGAALRYGSVDSRDGAPKQFFDLTSCSPRR